MEYINAELDIITVAGADVISASIEIDQVENELPIDKFSFANV